MPVENIFTAHTREFSANFSYIPELLNSVAKKYINVAWSYHWRRIHTYDKCCRSFVRQVNISVYKLTVVNYFTTFHHFHYISNNAPIHFGMYSHRVKSFVILRNDANFAEKKSLSRRWSFQLWRFFKRRIFTQTSRDQRRPDKRKLRATRKRRSRRQWRDTGETLLIRKR